jgi:peptidoglycan/LPS O-acetylase OafA/YrhL
MEGRRPQTAPLIHDPIEDFFMKDPQRLELSGHIPALDGLRGIAVLLVMWLHMTILRGEHTWDWLLREGARSWGWTGVDLFFVLSGFLITGILYEARGQRGYFRNFYARRVLRIFPLYYGFLLLLFGGGMAWLSSLTGRPATHEGQAWYWLYLSNFAMALHGDWPFQPLGSTWSLAIEEQFYLLWPLLVLFLSRTALMRTCVGIFFLALGCRLAVAAGQRLWMEAYILTPCRADSLAAGAFIALWARGPVPLARMTRLARWILWLAAASLSLILVLRGHLARDSRIVYTVGFSLITAFYGALLILAMTAAQGSRLRRALEGRTLRLFGHYSYALYLFSGPVTLLLEHYLPERRLPRLWGSALPGQLLFYGLGTVGSLGIAWVCWHAYEKHFLKLKRFFVYRKPASQLSSQAREEAA